jgi:MFS family permease
MPSLIRQLQAFPRPFWVLIGATFVNRFGVFVWPFLTIYITRNGNTASQAGVAVACYSVGGLCAAGLGGWLADRLGRNVTMALSSIGAAVFMMAMSQFTDWRWLSVMAFAVGLVSEAGHPAGVALLQDLVPAGHRIVGFAVHRFAVNLGWSFGPAVAGLMANHSFLWLFVIDAATSAFFGVIAWIYLPRGNYTERHLAGWGIAWRSIRANGAFLALCAACLFGSWIFRQTSTSFPLHYERSSLPLDWLGIVLALNGVMICAFELLLAAATRTWHVRLMLALGYVLMGGSFLLLLGGSTLAAFFITMIVFTLGEMFAFSRQQAYAASLAPEDMRGRYSGFLSFSWALGGIASSIGALALYEASPALVWLVTSVFGLVAAALIIWGGRPRLTAPP